MSKVGGNKGVQLQEQHAKRFNDTLKQVEKETANINAAMEKTRNWGVGIAAAGAAGVLLGKQLAQVYQEGARADAKLSAMLSKRGEGSAFQDMASWAGELADKAALVDDDPIKEAAAGLLGFGLNADQIKQIMPGLIGQSRLYGQSLDSVSEAFGRAFASGNAGALKRSGVTLSEADLKFVEGATTEIEKQNRMFQVVKASMDNYALSITEGMSESEIASNRFALAMDTAMSNTGKGAANADNFVHSLVGRILTIANASPAIQEGAGYFLQMGGYAATAAGSLGTVVSQVVMTRAALATLAAARVEEAAATAAATTATDANSLAAGANAAAKDVETLSTVAFTDASLASQVAVTGVGIAAGATVAAVGYAIGQHIGWINNELTFVQALSQGWRALGDDIRGTHDAALARNEIDAEGEIEKEKIANAKAVRDGKMTQAEADERNRKTEEQWRTRLADEARKHGDDQEFLRQQEKAAQLKRQDPKAMQPAPLAMPLMPAAAPMPSMPTAPAMALTGAGMAASMGSAIAKRSSVSPEVAELVRAAQMLQVEAAQAQARGNVAGIREIAARISQTLAKAQALQNGIGADSQITVNPMASMVGLLRSGNGLNTLSSDAISGSGRSGAQSFEKSFTLSPKDFREQVLPDGTKEFTFNVKGTFRSDDRLAASAASYLK